MNTRILAGVAVVAVVAGLGGTIWKIMADRSADPFAQCRAGQVAGGDIGGPFTLVDHDGRTVTDRDVITGPTLVYFGYTFCPDVCPLDNQRNVEAADILEEMGIGVTPVFITVDPARDTPEVMKSYVDNMDPRMIGLSGTEEQIRAAAQAYKTFYKIADPSEEFYLVEHMTFTYLMTPQHGFMDFFRREMEPEEMARRVACYVEAS